MLLIIKFLLKIITFFLLVIVIASHNFINFVTIIINTHFPSINHHFLFDFFLRFIFLKIHYNLFIYFIYQLFLN